MFHAPGELRYDWNKPKEMKIVSAKEGARVEHVHPKSRTLFKLKVRAL
jgi:hypothetical protein